MTKSSEILKSINSITSVHNHSNYEINITVNIPDKKMNLDKGMDNAFNILEVRAQNRANVIAFKSSL